MLSDMISSGPPPAAVAVRVLLLLLPPTALAALALWKKVKAREKELKNTQKA